MKDFAVDDDGDIIVEPRDIAYIYDDEEEIQKIRLVLGTNLGEWSLNESEGLDFAALFQHLPDETRIREAVQSTLLELDEDYTLTDCTYSHEKRLLAVQISAKKQSDAVTYTVNVEEG